MFTFQQFLPNGVHGFDLSACPSYSEQVQHLSFAVACNHLPCDSKET